MSKTVLAKVDGFTPLIDTIVSSHGIVTAAVFGRVWRYCQMKNGVCQASLETMAGEIGLSRITMIRHIDILVNNHYLKDHTPNLKNRPHTYSDTGKAGIAITVGVSERNRENDEEYLKDTVGVSERYPESILEILEDSNKRGIRKNGAEKTRAASAPRTPRKLTPLQEEQSRLIALFTELTGIPAPAPSTDKQRRAAATQWYLPIAEIIRVANGQSAECIRQAIVKLRQGNCTVTAPLSIQKTAIAILGTLKTQTSGIEYV